MKCDILLILFKTGRIRLIGIINRFDDLLYISRIGFTPWSETIGKVLVEMEHDGLIIIKRVIPYMYPNHENLNYKMDTAELTLEGHWQAFLSWKNIKKYE